MTQDEMVEILQKLCISDTTIKMYKNEFETFAKLIDAKASAREREACAKMCESEWSNIAEQMYGKECADAIRSRNEA